MKLSIIIVNYNASHFINQTIKSVLNSKINCNYEIIVVDNNSYDNSIELVRKDFPDLNIIQNTKNLGFSKGVNIGAQNSTGSNILILNPDTIVEENAIQNMCNTLDSNSEISVVGAKIIDPDGKFQLSSRRAYPTFLTSLFQISGLSYIFPKSKLFGRYNYTYISENSSHSVDSVSGACMMFDRKHFEELGGFDEDYFLFFEETDFCVRTKEIGKKVIYDSSASTIHYRGESMKNAPFNVNNIFLKSLMTFYRKRGNKNILSSILIRPFIHLAFILKQSTFFIKNNIRSIYQSFFDSLSILAAYSISLPLWYNTYYNSNIDFNVYLKHLPLLINYIVSWFFISSAFRIYRSGITVNREIYLVNVMVLLMASTTTYFISSIAYSRVILGLVFVISFLLSMMWRYAISFFTNYKVVKSDRLDNIFFQKVVFIGSSKKIKETIEKVLSSNRVYKKIVGYFDFKEQEMDIKYLGNFDAISDVIYEKNIDELIVDEDDINKLKLFSILSNLAGKSISLKIIPKDSNILIGKGSVEFVENLSLIEMDLPYFDRKNKIIKRLFDIFFSSIFICLTFPVHLIYIFSRFKTVSVHTINNKKINMKEYNSSFQTIRKLSYLWYILRGDISFVGSKIISSEEYDDQVILRPGIMGIYKLNNNVFEENKKYDFYYLENYSIFLDIEIIFKSLLLK